MVQTVMRAPNVVATVRRIIHPPMPYAFAFALGNAPILQPPIALGEEVTIVVANGLPTGHATHDWFTARVPTIPAVTGWVCVHPVCKGDILEVEVLGLEPLEAPRAGAILVTVTSSGERAGREPGLRRTVVPRGGIARMPVLGPEALVAFGPITMRRQGDGSPFWDPITAQVTVRCMTTPARSA